MENGPKVVIFHSYVNVYQGTRVLYQANHAFLQFFCLVSGYGGAPNLTSIWRVKIGHPKNMMSFTWFPVKNGPTSEVLWIKKMIHTHQHNVPSS
jgi:hypothetical protein